MTEKPTLVWFRDDRRLLDHPALHAAVERGAPLVLLYIFETDAGRPIGGARKVWLHHSLENLRSDIAAKGGRLILRRGEAKAVIDEVVETTNVGAVFWNRRYHEPDRDRDEAIMASLKARDIAVESFKGNLLIEPWEVETKSGTPYRVFTPFWRAAKDKLDVRDTLPVPDSLDCVDDDLASDSLDDWVLLPNSPDWG